MWKLTSRELSNLQKDTQMIHFGIKIQIIDLCESKKKKQKKKTKKKQQQQQQTCALLFPKNLCSRLKNY